MLRLRVAPRTPMARHLPTWFRRHLQEGGYAPRLAYAIYGALPDAPEVSRERHRSEGVPDGTTLTRDTARAWGRDDAVARPSFDALPDAVRDRVQAAEACLVLEGRPTGHHLLDYLRDTVGVIQALYEQGAVAVYDGHQRRWWSAEAWHDRIFAPAAPVPLHHVDVLVVAGPQGAATIRTQGLAKFGRPDVVVRHVPSDLHDPVVRMCERFASLQAFGGVVPDGQTIRMPGLPGWTCHTRGDGHAPDPRAPNPTLEVG